VLVGAPSAVLDFFSVHRLGEVFNRMDELGAEYWRTRFEQSVGAMVNLPAADVDGEELGSLVFAQNSHGHRDHDEDRDQDNRSCEQNWEEHSINPFIARAFGSHSSS